jgi:hypothetical protein
VPVELQTRVAALLTGLFLCGAATAEERQLLWGDTHLHSSNSFDAFLNRNRSADPATAYRYAQGLPVIHPYHRVRVQINTPLDFLVVADHAEYLGVMPTIVEKGIPREGLGFIAGIKAGISERWLRGVIEDDKGAEAFNSLLPKSFDSVEEAAAHPPSAAIPNAAQIMRTVWQEAVHTADTFNDPGRFTAMIGWEWSSLPSGANLHRVVLTSADAETASRFQPLSSSNSMYPEDLWAWLGETAEKTGAEFVSIPHNSNISKGYMFAETTLRGEPYDAELAATRARWESVAEISQIKGDSETHPAVSPDDPFADFETYTHYIQNDPPPYNPQAGDYIRSALLRGLAIEQNVGVNPFRFGVIGSTDSHTSMASAEEPNFWGKFATDSIPENKRSQRRGLMGPTGWSMSASGLAAVWARENTRAAILAAFRRREVYATTGPRIVVRVVGGYGFTDRDAAGDFEALRERGVPMGGTLAASPDGLAPSLVVQALRDPKGANLDRLQVVKGWVDSQGQTHERIYEVAWSGPRTRTPNGQLPEVGNTVDLATATYTNDIGSPELQGTWVDPDFDPAQSAFYYVRVLQIPTPRHSLYDALALGIDLSKLQGPATLQERAYTSPVWYGH